MRKMLAILLVVATSPAIPAEAPASNSYDRAMTALKQKDCKTAIAELEKYKIEEKVRLVKEPKFLASINEQIKICKVHLAEAEANPGSKIKVWGYIPR